MHQFEKPMVALAVALVLFVPFLGHACSRFTYAGPNHTVVTGRSMDWSEDLKTELWALPAGLSKKGNGDSNGVKWTSKYGSLIASGYNIGTADGINTEGLNANLLYLATSEYGSSLPSRQNLSVLNWAQYFLDNYASVEEAVNDFGKDKFNMIADPLPNGSAANVHLSITDRTGDNAIFEYNKGKLVVFHDKKYNVMTNEPDYDKQLALNDYWQKLKGCFLPGTGEPEDRFVRATYYLENIPQTSNEKESIAAVFSIIRNVSAPISAAVSGKPNVSPTIWRAVADLKNQMYYFESVYRPDVFWVSMDKLDLKPGASVKKLPLSNQSVYAGEVSGHFVENKPFFLQ